MDIAEVAKRAGVPASTLRYYEKRGLIESTHRQGTRRRFAPDVLDQLELITLGRAAGLSLDEIGSMLLLNSGPTIERKLIAAKADEIDKTIKQLRAVTRGLRHAVTCPAPSHTECPAFQRLMKSTAARALNNRMPSSEAKRVRK